MISHCRWGVTEEIKDQAQHLSTVGNYRVLIPDLYKGTVGVDAEEASHVYTPPAQMPSAKTQ
jgi:dienelactone hydrolase